MAKIGDGVPRLIDKAVDFMASSQAFMEYLKKSPRLQHVPATRRNRNQSVDF